MKLKPILPSLREKKRYVAFEITSKASITQFQAKKAITEKMQEFIGTLGMANAGLQFLPDWENNKGIYRVNTKYVSHSKACLALMKTINSQKVIVKSLGTTGVINKVRKKYFTKEGK